MKKKAKTKANSKKNVAVKKEASGIGLVPLSDRLLVREIEEKAEAMTDSGIYIPDSAKEDRGVKRGKVVAVGEGRYDDGVLIPIKVKVGETVLFQWGDKISYKGEDYTLVRESEIVAVIR